MPASTVGMWAARLSRDEAEFDFGDAQEAIATLGDSRPRMPSLRELEEAIIDERRVRLRNRPKLFGDEPAGPYLTWSEFLETHPEIAQRVRDNGWLRNLEQEPA
jgi:hypothetical protein